jgi:hypothetical protein
LARNGDVERFRAYVRSNAFLEAFTPGTPEERYAVGGRASIV